MVMNMNAAEILEEIARLPEDEKLGRRAQALLLGPHL